MVDPREQSLPKWAQAFIKDLRNEHSRHTEFLTKEVVRLRPLVEVLTNRLNAMDEIMRYLIKGGHPDGQMIHDIVGSYGLNIVEPDKEKT